MKTGRRRGGALEIVSGVNAGQQVVASGQNKLQAGATGQDRQHHRCDQARRAEARERAIGISHEFHRTLHPPPRPVDGGEPPDPAARRAGADEPPGASVSRGRGNHDHDHDDLYGRERRPDAGLHQHAHRQVRVERRRRRLRHVAEPPRRQHGLGAHAPEHRSERGAHRSHREGAAGARAAAHARPRIR